jgi:transposase InsO family protein
VGDITYIATDEGWLFLAVVIDLFSRQVVGWSLRDEMKNQLVIDALHTWRGSSVILVDRSDRSFTATGAINTPVINSGRCSSAMASAVR